MLSTGELQRSILSFSVHFHCPFAWVQPCCPVIIDPRPPLTVSRGQYCDEETGVERIPRRGMESFCRRVVRARMALMGQLLMVARSTLLVPSLEQMRAAQKADSSSSVPRMMSKCVSGFFEYRPETPYHRTSYARCRRGDDSCREPRSSGFRTVRPIPVRSCRRRNMDVKYLCLVVRPSWCIVREGDLAQALLYLHDVVLRWCL